MLPLTGECDIVRLLQSTVPKDLQAKAKFGGSNARGILMSATIPVANCAALPEERFEPLRHALCRQSSIERALGWFFAANPPLTPEDLIPQDEFSYDLLVPYPGGLYLSYDTS